MIRVLGCLFVMAIIAFIVFLAHFPHRHDKELKARCEAAGGVFIEAREPLHVCVKPLEPNP